MKKYILFLLVTIMGFGQDPEKFPLTHIDMIVNFDIKDFFLFQEDLKKSHIDLSVKDTIPLISQVFFGPTNSEKIIIFNLLLEKEVLAKIPKEKLIYFLWEPWEVPSDYYQSFGRIYTWNDDLIDNVKFFKIHYPSLLPMESTLPSFKEKKLCIMIAGTDVDPKERNNDLYSERMRMVEFFETKPRGEFALYGRSWTSRPYRDYLGEIPGFHSGKEKISVLKQYRFSVCFENTKNINGYVTEKIFCCFAAGCVPIYWGAKNIDKYIPKECYIDYRNFKTKEDLYHFLKTMPEAEYEKYLVNIRKFLNSEQAQVFSPAYFQKTFQNMALQPINK